MPLINFRNVLSCSSEDRIHCAENLLKPEQYKKWLSSKGGEERVTCILELEKSSSISSVDVGNDGSAFVELFVSRSSSSRADDWTVLVPATLMMTPSESRSNTNRNHVKLLKTADLNKTCLGEKWDRLKIVCEQKFNRLSPFGLCFIKLYSPSTLSDETNQSDVPSRSSVMLGKANLDDDDETEKEQGRIGSFFAKKQAEKKLMPSEPSASDQIRALSNVADELLSKKPMNDTEIQTLLKKDVKSTPTRLSKRSISPTTTQSPTTQNDAKRSRTTTNPTQIMKKVVFVLSGFQNPLRTDLRTKATKMGATYNDDWDGTCTHLICAFPNTPKYTQVKQSGKGAIVSKQWILDCYQKGQLLSERDYQLKGSTNHVAKTDTPEKTARKTRTFDDADEEEADRPAASSSVSKTTPVNKKVATVDDEKPSSSTSAKKKMATFDDTDDEETDDEQVVSKDVTKKPTAPKSDANVYDAETDEDEPQAKKGSGELPDFFRDKHFYVYDNEFDDDTCRDIRRVIYAYDGVLEKQLASGVAYVITNRLWNQEFDEASKVNSKMKFLSLDWLQDCHDENKLVACQPYLVLPSNE